MKLKDCIISESERWLENDEYPNAHWVELLKRTVVLAHYYHKWFSKIPSPCHISILPLRIFPNINGLHHGLGSWCANCLSEAKFTFGVLTEQLPSKTIFPYFPLRTRWKLLGKYWQ
jgi:hypothetical protein